jgi:hypothetical protein
MYQQELLAAIQQNVCRLARLYSDRIQFFYHSHSSAGNSPFWYVETCWTANLLALFIIINKDL